MVNINLFWNTSEFKYSHVLNLLKTAVTAVYTCLKFLKLI